MSSESVFLTRLRLNGRSRQVRSEVGSPYEMHRTLVRGVTSTAGSPDAEAAAIVNARMLFRVDGVTPRGEVITLVQTRIVPDWRALEGLDGYLLGAPATRELRLDVPTGMRLAFRLRANPTVKREGKRLGLYREDEQLAWIARKGDRHGFRPLTVSANCEARAQRSQRRGDAVEHLAVRFDGILSVTDPVALRDAVSGGIGSAKGFGYGLLSLARVDG